MIHQKLTITKTETIPVTKRLSTYPLFISTVVTVIANETFRVQYLLPLMAACLCGLMWSTLSRVMTHRSTFDPDPRSFITPAEMASLTSCIASPAYTHSRLYVTVDCPSVRPINVMHSCSETVTGFTVKLKPVSINGSHS